MSSKGSAASCTAPTRAIWSGKGTRRTSSSWPARCGRAERPCASVLRFGNPARELSRTVADEKIDLLVLGSHGHGKIGDWFFGETAGTVRHAVRIPVLAVRDSRRPNSSDRAT